ncbi:MAG: alpha/beta hydrolase [Deltaproteobacteria bacterium]|nr:alpha/beta hydrolase [Deltaproteobacteria bacterium]
MPTVTSKDGTTIGYEKLGNGPPLILVDGALCSRQFGPSRDLAKHLASDFTVFFYDRRGRGESGDTKPYDRAREVEDLAALIDVAGGKVSLLGLSSGAALALEAAASDLPVTRVFAYEPPYVRTGGRDAPANHQRELERLVAEDRRGDAVKFFMRDMVHVPGPVVVMMRLMFWMWPKLCAVAHTLPYDAAVMGDFTAPTQRLAKIQTPVMIGFGGKTTEELKVAARAVAGAIPGAASHEFAGQNHAIGASALVPTAAAFLRA